MAEKWKPMTDIDCVVWDFDGVLNRNIVNGRFLWTETFEADHGVSLAHFRDYIFSDEFKRVLRGEKDLRDHVGEWVATTGYDGSADDIMDYWFKKDARPDGQVVEMVEELKRRGKQNVIGTNNEPYRTAFIKDKMGFGKLVDAIYASGQMGCIKPEAAFFDAVANELDTGADRLLLVDDSAHNVERARSRGWNAFHFENGDYDRLRQRLELD